MDDGTPIRLSVTVDRRDGSAAFDFAGTGPEVLCNANAPPAVTWMRRVPSSPLVGSPGVPESVMVSVDAE